MAEVCKPLGNLGHTSEEWAPAWGQAELARAQEPVVWVRVTV